MVTARATSDRLLLAGRVLLLVLLTSVSVLACRGEKHEAVQAERADFRSGRQLVIAGQYAKAIPLLENHIKAHPSGKFGAKAGLFLGKAHLGLGQLARAKSAFSRAAKDYPQALEGHKCSYKLALVDLLQGDRSKALSGFEALAKSPSGPLAGEASAMAAYLRGAAASAPQR